MDYFEKDWDLILNVEKNDVNHSFDNFLSNMNGLLDKHALFKEISKYQLKLKTKPWITAAIHKSILVENYLFKKYIKLKDPVKKLKHMINTSTTETYFELIKKSKKKCCNKFFKTNMNDIKNTWKRIRNVISWKQFASAYIHLLSQDNETVSNPKKIVNIFNDYFSTIAEKAKAKVRFSNKSSDEFLHPAPNENSLFIRPTRSDEITNLILSLNESKSVGPNGLPRKILKLLKNLSHCK